MDKFEYVYKNSEDKVKELRLWGKDDFYLGAYIVYKDGTHHFVPGSGRSGFQAEELEYMAKQCKKYKDKLIKEGEKIK